MSKRTQPRQSAPSVKPQLQEQIVVQEREYKVITPLFGGGALAGQRDEVTIIRGTEIRGHLRFWWRACFGGRYKDVEEMKREEDRIWGAASQAKKEEKKTEESKKAEAMLVQIVVEILNKGTEIEPFPILTSEEYKKKKGRETSNNWEALYASSSGIPLYAAFMFQLSNEEKLKEKRPNRKLAYKNVEFKLIISFPKEIQTDIEGALWAWETFGGIGARTRRGFGALSLDKAEHVEIVDGTEKRERILQTLLIADEEKVRQWIIEKFTEFGIEKKAPPGIPSLGSNMRFEIITTSKAANGTWNDLINALAKFRQMRDGSQNNRGHFGRSKWPEAEAIRDLIGRRYYKSLAHPQKFPRAAFGLPIIFHFKDSGDGRNFDPHDSTLQGSEEGHDRLASPLILRPLLCNDNYAVGLAAVLENAFLPDKLLLKEEGGESYKVKPHIEHQEVAKIEPLKGQTDILQAFINYLKGK